MMDKKYQPCDHEDKIYAEWEGSGGFKPSKQGEPFSIIMPPPNANDPLHVGHAMFVTLEDILIRFQRMRGKSTLWLPGTDHAGIETQFVFEKKLKKKGESRFNFDRETLYKMIWDYVQENSEVSINQMKKLGASADWSKSKFTLDDDVVDFVLDTFIKLHKDDLIYRDLKLVNYCTKCGTAFSNLEVNHMEKKEPLYYLKYGPFVLATVRPETKFGDTAVAVHPNDKRYQKWIGKEIEVEGLTGKFKLKVIADDFVDPEFGTGVVKITPAHDFDDYEVGKRHNLKLNQVIDFNGKLNKKTGKYQGLRIMKAREEVVKDLKAKGLIEKIDREYVHNVGTCYRCGNNLEPLPLPQFFIKVKDLTTQSLKALKENKVKILGSGHDKILKHWLENLHDWNISRQIVWGIRIPVWYCENKASNKVGPSFADAQVNTPIQDRGSQKGSDLTDLKGSDLCYVVSKKKPEKCPKCGATEFKQETDTFDTWFSSSQWPVVTLKTSGKGDFEKFYPTSVMETGHDILPIWVMRMLMMGIYLTEDVPFKKVYLHGMVRDEKGQKMSKSKGNVINPLEAVEKFGADALRMSLVMSTTAGKDSATGEGKMRGMRNLTNKIWNASRYIVEFMEESDKAPGDKKFLKKLGQVSKGVTKQLDELKIGLAAETVYGEFWHWFCDESIEKSKQGEISKKTLIEGLRTFLKLLHPFTPFVTEAVWKELPKTQEKVLMTAKWPE